MQWGSLCNVRGTKTMTVTMVGSEKFGRSEKFVASSRGSGIPTVNWLQIEECQAGNWEPQ